VVVPDPDPDPLCDAEGEDVEPGTVIETVQVPEL
jgi:hypothetical protein